MTKIIHCIKIGTYSEMGDFELSCIESWKKVYPDFEIKYWTDKEILPLLSDCRYAVNCYNTKQYAFVTDYLRLKIIYTEGGMYMDTDVFCVERIPDKCFETTFSCWDGGFDTYWSLNGVCLYSPESGDRILKEMIELYQSYDENHITDNTSVETVLRKHGIDFYNRTSCRFSNQLVDNDYAVYNCIQFGAWDHKFKCYNYNPNLPVFLVHCGTKTWKGYGNENIQIFYAFLNEDTDINKLSAAVNTFIDMKVSEKVNPVLLIAVNCINGKEEIFAKRLWMRLGDKGRKAWDIFPIGNKLEGDELNSAFMDFVSKRYNKIKFCRDIMEGSFTGDLSV